jgi:hypothetical protein
LRVPARTWLLVLLSILAGLLVPTPAAAADDVYILATEGTSGPAQEIVPLGQTAAGLVYRNEDTSTTWVKRASAGAIAQQESRLGGDPTLVGDLLSRYDPDTATLRWRTIADPTLHDTVVPAELTFVSRTKRGYLAREGSGPYDLVSVDLVASGSRKVIGNVEQLDGPLIGPEGVAFPSSDVPNQWEFYPYDGSAPGGRLLQAPAGADDCVMSWAYLFCWSPTELTRLPLSGSAGGTVPAAVRTAIGAGDGGIAWTTLDSTGNSYEIWIWRLGLSFPPYRVVTGAEGLTEQLVPASGSSDLALGVKPEGSGSAIYRITTSRASLALSGQPQPGAATSIALGPGRVAWGETGAGIRGRDVTVRADGGLEMGVLQAHGDGTAPSVSGPRIAYATGSGLATTVAGDPVIAADEVVGSTVSGQRMVWQSRDADGDLAWHLTDLTAKNTEPLPEALAYDLWGERLVRLDADGSVELLDLRTGDDPVELAPALAGGAESGTVHVAGDVVAWDVSPADGTAPDPGVLLRDVGTMDPAEPLAALTVLHDLSPGYAAGCSDEDECAPVAVSLADGTTTAVASDKPVAVDGNLLGFLTAEDLPAARILPASAEPPRLLASPGVPDAVDFGRGSLTLRVAASEPLTSCALEIRNAANALLRTLQCGSAKYGSAMVEWNGYGSTSAVVADGTYTWRIVAANGNRAVVDYDGAPAGGTLIVDSPPKVTKITPGPGSYKAALGTSVSVTFTEPVADVSDTTFQLRRPDGTTVPGSVAYDATTRTATLTPSAPLNPLTRHTVTLTGITDLRGNPVSTPTSALAFTTGPASTASHCSLVMPSKVVVDARTERMNFTLSSNCTANGADHAYWNLKHTGTGSGWAFRFESADLGHRNWYVDWPDTAPMGRWSLSTVEAERADGTPLPQNSAAIQAKYGSRLAATVSRTRTTLTWKVTASQWSPTKHAWGARSRVSVGLFHQATGSSTWKYVKAVTTTSTGKATVTLASPKAGSYRLSVGETSTVWASYSTPVRGR